VFCPLLVRTPYLSSRPFLKLGVLHGKLFLNLLSDSRFSRLLPDIIGLVPLSMRTQSMRKVSSPLPRSSYEAVVMAPWSPPGLPRSCSPSWFGLEIPTFPSSCRDFFCRGLLHPGIFLLTVQHRDCLQQVSSLLFISFSSSS